MEKTKPKEQEADVNKKILSSDMNGSQLERIALQYFFTGYRLGMEKSPIEFVFKLLANINFNEGAVASTYSRVFEDTRFQD